MFEWVLNSLLNSYTVAASNHAKNHCCCVASFIVTYFIFVPWLGEHYPASKIIRLIVQWRLIQNENLSRVSNDIPHVPLVLENIPNPSGFFNHPLPPSPYFEKLNVCWDNKVAEVNWTETKLTIMFVQRTPRT